MHNTQDINDKICSHNTVKFTVTVLQFNLMEPRHVNQVHLATCNNESTFYTP